MRGPACRRRRPYPPNVISVGGWHNRFHPSELTPQRLGTRRESLPSVIGERSERALQTLVDYQAHAGGPVMALYPPPN